MLIGLKGFDLGHHTFYRQHLRADTESQPQQHTWTSEFFVLFPLRNNRCT